jgi:hypothetical protein
MIDHYTIGENHNSAFLNDSFKRKAQLVSIN